MGAGETEGSAISPEGKGAPGAVTGEGSAAFWEKWLWIFAAIFAVADFISISVAQISAGLMGVCWIAFHVKKGTRPDFSPLLIPMAAFTAISLLAAFFSMDAMESIKDSKDLTHVLIFFIVYDYLKRHREKINPAMTAVLAGGSIAAVYGLGQLFTRGIDIYNRISGFQDIYMTFAGLLMLAASVAFAAAVFGGSGRHRSAAAIAGAAMTFAVLISLTRNAVLGVGAATVVILILRKPVALLVLPAVLAAAIVLSPQQVSDRMKSIADPYNETNRERLYLWEAGIKIIKDHPVLGVGQNSFPKVYPQYRHPKVKEPNISHLHNNFLEIGAERGLIALAIWIWLWGAAAFFMIKGWRETGEGAEKAALAAGLGALAAFIVAGLFEYNFGASVMQMMIYYILAVALAAVPAKRAEEDAPAP